MSAWEEHNANLVMTLAAALNDWPQTIPSQVAPAVRSAVSAYQAGDRDPELMFFLSAMYAMRNDNAIRYRLHNSGMMLAQEFAL